MNSVTTTPPPHTAYERSTHSRTLAEMFLTTGSSHEGTALRYPDGAGWRDVSYAELGATVREIGRGLMALGIRAGDRVSIISETRPEWTYADGGCLCAGAVVAPIYHTNSPEECRYVLTHSQARAVFAENAGQLAKIEAVRDECPDLEHVIAFDGAIPGSISLDELRERGATVSDGELEDRADTIADDQLATLIYTSGTTGPPKGCMLTHRNFLMTMQLYEEQLELRETGRTFMFLPLAHSMGRIIQMLTLDVGATLAYWRRDPGRLLDDIRETSPTHLSSVPRIFEKIHTRAQAGLEEGSAVQRAVFDWALRVGRRARALERRGRSSGRLLRAQHALADRLVLSRVRGLFGDSLEIAISGAAPIPLEVLKFFDTCGVVIREAWGMTETTAAGTLNTVWNYSFGTVGRPLPGVEIRIAEDGEILIKGPNVCSGYWRDRDATEDALQDGWLATGDLGSVDDGFLSITGRKKDIIITSSGKNITPVNMENELRTIRWVSEAVVFGDDRPYLVALLTLDPEEAPALAEHVAAPSADLTALARDPGVRGELHRQIEEINGRFARIEQIKRFGILDRQLTQAEGDLTPTLKVKRAVAYDRFADRFAALYEDGSPDTVGAAPPADRPS